MVCALAPALPFLFELPRRCLKAEPNGVFIPLGLALSKYPDLRPQYSLCFRRIGSIYSFRHKA